MGKRRVVGAITTGIRTHIVLFSDYFLKALTQGEQDAIIARELAHTKQSHALKSVMASFSFYFAGWNLFFFAAVPNLQTPNLPDSWVSGMAETGIILYVTGITMSRPYLAAKSQTHSDEIAANVLGRGASLIRSMNKLNESTEMNTDQKEVP